MKNQLITFARGMRNFPTKAEQKLWWVLKNEKALVGKFRRQHPFGGKFIADFISLEHKLVVEIDGEGHNNQTDAMRDEFMQKEGYRILRFSSDDILSRMPRVIHMIAEMVTPSALLRKAPPPSRGRRA